MSSLLDVRIGAQRPQRQHLPPDVATSDGPDAVEFAKEAGLILDDWQAWVLEHGLGTRADGQWAAFEVAVIVARQNGKGSILEALELYHLFVLGTKLIVHTAHEFKTAFEHFLRVRFLIENSSLNDDVEHFYSSNARLEIVLKNGARLKFIARSGGSGRGFSSDLLILDEAYEISEGMMGAVLPTLSARENPQIWYTSSAPHADSHVLHALRRRGIAGDAGRLFMAEWGNDPDCDRESDEPIYAANPGIGIRISLEYAHDERATLRELGDEYDRERLGIPSEEDSTAGVFPPGVWAALGDENSRIDSGLRIALDVAPDMAWSSFAAAGLRADGLAHLELIERHPGTSWVVEKAVQLAAKYGPLVVDPRAPVGGLLEDLKAAHVGLLEAREGAFPKACALLQERVVGGTVRHLGQKQPPLNAAVAGAAITTAGDAWRWSRARSDVDISPLVACTLALWATTQAGGPAKYFSFSEL